MPLKNGGITIVDTELDHMHHDQWCNLEKMATELSCLGGEYRQIYEQSSLRENDSHSYRLKEKVSKT